MRTRSELENTWIRATLDVDKEGLVMEILLDMRDSLQKLVEKGQKTKVITTEIPFTEKEEKLFNGLSRLDI